MSDDESDPDAAIFKSLVHHAASGMALADHTGRYIMANPSYCRLTGKSAEELRSGRLHDMIHVNDKSAFVPLFEQAAESGKGSEIILRHLRADGSAAQVVAAISAAGDANAGAPAVLIVCNEISAFKSSSQIQSIYEAALANTPDFVYLMSLDHRFIYANAALLNMWGRTAQQAFGKTFVELGYETWHADMHIGEIDQVIASRKSIKGEVPFTGMQGRRIYEYIFSPVFGDNGAITAIAGTTRDVTERKKMEEALRESEERGRLALEASEFIGTWSWDLLTNLLVADERFALLYSVDPAWAAKGAPIEEYTRTIHPDDLTRFNAVTERVITDGGQFDEEYRLVRPEGDIRWVVARGRTHEGEDGRPIRFAGAAVDITERKLVESSLRESEQQFRRMTDALPQQIWSARPDGQIDYINENTRSYTGEIPQTNGVLHWAAVVYADDFPSSTQAWLHSIATGEPYEVQQRILHKHSGKYRWHLSRALPARDAQGEIVKWFGTNTDIEDQKRATEAASEASEHLSLMVESAQDYAIISADPDGIIISWSKGAERVFGYTPEEAIGKNIHLIFTREDIENGVAEHELRVAANQGRASDERWHLRRNGERFYASGIMAAMRDQAKNIKGFIKIARDMTREQEAQEDLIAARNAAEAANIAKTEFLANMSHEIRTPMNAVLGLANLLAVSKPLTERQQEFIKTLQMSADSLLALINDLLDIAKIEARTVDLEHLPFSLDQLIQEVTSMMGVRVREKGLIFSGDSDCVKNRQYLGDPTRLRQIILNLCSNAVKFTEKGGIHISVSCTPLEGKLADTVRIAISDTGIGIAAEKRETIFQKFVQADTSINRKYGGTGLGLAITKTLIGIMSGTVSVESQEGAGSTFTVCLPLAIAEPQDVQTSSGKLTEKFASHEGVKSRKVILLVEDYAPNVLVASTFLEQFGYVCDVATSGVEAVEKMKTGRYAAVLMDVQMHGMNGLEATRMLREHERKHTMQPVPIIGMTAHALAGDRDRCIAAGMDGYISKPFNPVELEALIKIYLADRE